MKAKRKYSDRTVRDWASWIQGRIVPSEVTTDDRNDTCRAALMAPFPFFIYHSPYSPSRASERLAVNGEGEWRNGNVSESLPFVTYLFFEADVLTERNDRFLATLRSLPFTGRYAPYRRWRTLFTIGVLDVWYVRCHSHRSLARRNGNYVKLQQKVIFS